MEYLCIENQCMSVWSIIVLRISVYMYISVWSISVQSSSEQLSINV